MVVTWLTEFKLDTQIQYYELNMNRMNVNHDMSIDTEI
jgi:hypothetical protein